MGFDPSNIAQLISEAENFDNGDWIDVVVPPELEKAAARVIELASGADTTKGVRRDTKWVLLMLFVIIVVYSHSLCRHNGSVRQSVVQMFCSSLVF